MNEKEKIVIFDWSVYMFKAIFAYPNNPSIPPTYTCLNMLLSHLAKIGITPDDSVIISLDARNSWRKDFETEYKGNRKEQREKSGIDFDHWFEEFNKLETRLKEGLDWNFLRCERCLSGESFISTPNGLKRLKNCKVGESIKSWNEKNRKIEISKITKVFKSKSSERYNIYFNQINTPIKITGNHPLYSKRGWIEAKDCQLGDIIYTDNDFYINSNSKNLRDIGYITGYSYGDGCINRTKKTLQIDSIDIEGLRHIKALLRKEFNIRISKFRKIIQKNSKWSNYYHLQMFNSRVFDSLFSDKNFLMDKDYLKGFIAGFYDAEGTLNKKRNLIGIYNTNYELISYIEKGLKILGFNPKVNLYNKAKNPNHKPIYRLDINKQKEVINFFEIFNTQIIRKRLNTIRNGATIIRIEKIQQSNKFENFNLEVQPNNTYFANNLLVHNCESDDVMAVACRYYTDKEVILVTHDADLEQCWEYDNVKIFSPSSKKWKVKPKNFDLNHFQAKKIHKEVADNMVTPILSEEDYERRKICVDLIKLPDWVESAIRSEFDKIQPKSCNIEAIPFKSLQPKLANIYNDTSKIMRYEDQIAKEEEEVQRIKKKKQTEKEKLEKATLRVELKYQKEQAKLLTRIEKLEKKTKKENSDGSIYKGSRSKEHVESKN